MLGTGKIGEAFTRIAHGFGMDVLAHDPYVDDDAVAHAADVLDRLNAALFGALGAEPAAVRP